VKLSREKVDLKRATKCMTVAAMAEAYGVSRARMNAILNQREVTPVTAGRIAKALGCDVTEILETE
jgi:plasmid maintenance system antidote protein VapI